MPAGSRTRLSKKAQLALRETNLRMGNKEAMYIGKKSVIVLYWEAYWDEHAKDVIHAFTIDVELEKERTRRHRFETFDEAMFKWDMLKREVAIKTAEIALNLETKK
jgi:hypothetical protein